VAIAPQPLVAEDLRAGRLVRRGAFSETPAQLALWLPKRAADGRAGNWRNGSRLSCAQD
jgi:hypothetical protein